MFLVNNNVVGAISNLPEVHPVQMIPENYYVCAAQFFDDFSGEDRIVSEIVWFHEDHVIGDKSGKKAKLIRFSKNPAVKRFSQLLGCKFYGPFGISYNESPDQPAVVVKEDLEKKDEYFSFLEDA